MSEYQGKTAEELRKALVEKQESFRAFRFDMSGSKVKNVRTGRVLRKDIARILTEINRK